MEAVNGCSKEVMVNYVALNDKGRPTRKSKTVNVDIPAGGSLVFLYCYYGVVC